MNSAFVNSFFWPLLRPIASFSMEPLEAFSTTEKTAHNSHKFGFTLSPTNYGYWKTMIQPFLTTNNRPGYVDGTILCPQATTTSEKETSSTVANPSYAIWIANDAHVCMLLPSTFLNLPSSMYRGLPPMNFGCPLNEPMHHILLPGSIPSKPNFSN